MPFPDRERARRGPAVLGRTVDGMTRCVHYRSELDIVAVKFKCCGEYYPCHLCHKESAGHPAEPWPVSARAEKAVLCGACRTEMSIEEYFSCGDRCPNCGESFNPACAAHRGLYFEI